MLIMTNMGIYIRDTGGILRGGDVNVYSMFFYSVVFSYSYHILLPLTINSHYPACGVTTIT